jgi:hypothetical protein
MEAYNSLNLIGIIGSRRMRGVGHVAPRGRGRVQNAVWEAYKTEVTRKD